MQPDEDWLVTTTLPSTTDQPTNSCTVCTTMDSQLTTESIYNDTCVGELEYCNYTEGEYNDMLYNYIFPTPGEWVAIGFHLAVFLVGLVSSHI